MREIKYAGIEQSPRDFLKKRSLMSSLGKAEAEEVLSRILRFCWKCNNWVAPTAEELDAQVKADLDQIREANEIRQRNFEKRIAYEKASRSWFRRFFGKKLAEPEYEEEVKTPSTFLTINPNALTLGIHYMMDHGFLEIEKEDGEVFFRVTEKALLSMPIVG